MRVSELCNTSVLFYEPTMDKCILTNCWKESFAFDWCEVQRDVFVRIMLLNIYIKSKHNKMYFKMLDSVDIQFKSSYSII